MYQNEQLVCGQTVELTLPDSLNGNSEWKNEGMETWMKKIGIQVIVQWYE